jgi:hypothetical protein
MGKKTVTVDYKKNPPKIRWYGGGSKIKSFVGAETAIKLNKNITVIPSLGQFNKINKNRGLKVKGTGVRLTGVYKVNKNLFLSIGANKNKTRIVFPGGKEVQKDKGFNVGITYRFK